jgi:hypothetical protein
VVKSRGLEGRITSWMEGWEGCGQVGVKGAISDGILWRVVRFGRVAGFRRVVRASMAI